MELRTSGRFGGVEVRRRGKRKGTVTVSGQLGSPNHDPIKIEITFPADPDALDALLGEDSNEEFGSSIRAILMQAMRPLFFKRSLRVKFAEAVKELAPYAYVIALDAIKQAVKSIGRANPPLQDIIKAVTHPRLKKVLEEAHTQGFRGKTATEWAALLVERCLEPAREKFHIKRPTEHPENFLKLYITGHIRLARARLRHKEPISGSYVALLLHSQPGQGAWFWKLDR